jgi:hypothetical protein
MAALMACASDEETTKRHRDDDSATVDLPSPEGPLLLISETSTGRLLIHDTATGTRIGSQCLVELHPEACAKGSHGLDQPCLMFGNIAEVVDDSDVLTLSYTLRNPGLTYAPGAIARIRPAHPPKLEWVISDLMFPDDLLAREELDCPPGNVTPECHMFGTHIALPDPSGEVIVADTSNSRILWVEPPEDDGTIGHVTAVLSHTHADMAEAMFVNHLQRIESGDSVWLLATFKGPKSSDKDAVSAGRIMLWDITDKDHPTHLWTYPGRGSLAAVHHGSMHHTPQGPLLLYAHSLGAGSGAEDGMGSVGIAKWNDEDPPVYLGDGVLSDEDELGFVRAVEYNDATGKLLITDSGCENADIPCDRSSEILLAKLPTLEETGLSGAWNDEHRNQFFFALEKRALTAPSDLRLPFSASLVPLSDLANPLSVDPLGRCP